MPVYFFGNSALLSAWSVPGLQAVSRALRMSVIFPFGRFGLAMPFQKPITMVCPARSPRVARHAR